MESQVRLALAVVPLLLLSGCFVAEDDPDTDDVAADADGSSGSTSLTLTGAPSGGNASSVAPVIVNVTANATGLSVAFTILASDADNDPLTFTIAFGDNATGNGTLVPATDANATAGSLLGNVTHTYAAAGTYNATVTVSDGTNAVDQTVAVAAGGASVQEPLHFEGTVECLPTLVRNGELAGGAHAFEVLAGQRTMVITLAYESGDTDDLDYTATDAAGGEHESAEAGPEPPMTIEAPAAGAWSLDIVGYSCMLELDYTVDITFA